METIVIEGIHLLETMNPDMGLSFYLGMQARSSGKPKCLLIFLCYGTPFESAPGQAPKRALIQTKGALMLSRKSFHGPGHY